MRLQAAIVATLLLVAGCKKASPEETLVKNTDKAAAWIPSLQMIAEKWLANGVPANFVKNAADAASKDFEKANDDIAKSDASSELRQRLERDLAAGHRFADDLQAALEADNPRLIAPKIATLAAPQRDLDEIQKKYRGGS